MENTLQQNKQLITEAIQLLQNVSDNLWNLAHEDDCKFQEHIKDLSNKANQITYTTRQLQTQVDIVIKVIS